MSGSGWWYRASQSQKLGQVDAARELGMTAKAVAIVCGAAAASTVHDFARRHGRYFDEHAEAAAETGIRAWSGTDRRAPMRQAAQAFYKGETVDFWGGTPRVVARDELPEVAFE
jgi:hypothetical protein